MKFKLSKYQLIAASLLIVGVTSISIYTVKKNNPPSSGCNLPGGLNFGGEQDRVACVGQIVIDRADICFHKPECNVLRAYDLNRNFAYVTTIERYQIVDNFVYIEGNLAFSTYSNDKSGKAFVFLPSNKPNQKDEFRDYNSVAELPHYLKLDSNTGLITPYVTFDEIPEGDRAIFEKL